MFEFRCSEIAPSFLKEKEDRNEEGNLFVVLACLRVLLAACQGRGAPL